MDMRTIRMLAKAPLVALVATSSAWPQPADSAGTSSSPAYEPGYGMGGRT